MPKILDAVLTLDHITGLQCFSGFGFFTTPAKLGMHKMELGDSVYAAERIMKKRIRKVSFTSFVLTNTATDPNLAKPAFEITYQPQLLFGAPYCKLHVSQ